MAEKLNWVWDDKSQEQIAEVRQDIRIRAVRDEHPENPFEAWDGNWPITVRLPDGYGGRSSFTHYNKQGGSELLQPLDRFTDALLLHMQVHIAKVLDNTVGGLIECYGHSEDELPEGKKLGRDANALRDAFTGALEDVGGSARLETCVKLYDMLGIPAIATTVRGYSQGDWSEVLVVATPEAQAEFGTDLEAMRRDVLTELCMGQVNVDALENVVAAQLAKKWEKQLGSTADLYAAWAFGDVYGYIVERATGDPDDPEWEEVEDGSCWGYYGSDHGDSGLEECALSAVPTEEQEEARLLGLADQKHDAQMADLEETTDA